MKYIVFLFFLGISPSLFSQDGALPGFYHTYEDIESQLNAWDEEFGSTPSGSNGIIFHKEVLGYSTEDNLPFWGVKISDNANVDEDEPRILILGQCHAEEIYGVEISMALINCFLNLSSGGVEECFNSEIAGQVFPNLQNLEIWFVPTHNPEGLRVVHGYEETDGDTTQWIQDVSYRKNKRDVNGDGIFNFDNTVEAGSDSDGVDLNRNYDFNWIFGDDLYVENCNGGYCSHFDYYRGEAPFSESETKAIRDFAIEKQFLLSIAYHSSRSGNVSEKVIYSWEWGDGTKYSPDFDVIHDIGVNIANLTLKDAVDGSTYDPTTSKSIKGNAHDWFYTETGCIQYLIETGTANMQSIDSTHVYQIKEDNFNGAFYLFNRAWGNSNNSSLSADKYQITGIVTDAVTGETVHASVKILEMDGSVLKPRFTDNFGRYRRLLNGGDYTLKVSAEGYEDYEQSIYSSESEVTEHNVVLIPSPIHDLTIDLTVPNGFPGPFQLIRHTELITDTLELDFGENQFSWFEGVYRLTVINEGLSPAVNDLSLTGDETIPVNLTQPEIIFDENFNNLDEWNESPLDWNANGTLQFQTSLTYPNSIESTLMSNFFISELGESHAIFQVELKYELEWEYDTLSLGLFDIGQNQTFWVKHWTNQNWVEHTEYVPAILDSGASYFTVIRLKTDGSVQYRGLEMESLTLMKGSTVELATKPSVPVTFEFSQNYPNPFNATTNFTFSIFTDSHIDFTIYNLQGRVVSYVKENAFYQRGSHTITYQANHLSSGIYFYSITSDKHTKFNKMIVLK